MKQRNKRIGVLASHHFYPIWIIAEKKRDEIGMPDDGWPAMHLLETRVVNNVRSALRSRIK